MKTKLVIGIVLAAVLLLVIGQYFFLPVWYREAGIRASGWLIMLSVAVGIALSLWLLDATIKKLLAGKLVDLFGLSTAARTGSKIGAYVGGLGSYPFALFLGFVVGGSLGGGWGEVLLGTPGIVMGIGLGLFAVATLVSVVAALIGFVLGGFTEKLVRTLHA